MSSPAQQRNHELSGAELAALRSAAAGDAARLEASAARVRAGEPLAYVVGVLEFRGRRFRVDRRAYITDPELTHLVDAVASEGHALERAQGRVPRMLEFGVGAGTLAISLKLEHPGWQILGLDVDTEALVLARENAAGHHAEIRLLESDYFESWPDDEPPPDVIFGDPPWGAAGDLYNVERGADYYRSMPAKSAFPPDGNPCSVHDELIRRVRARRWPSRLILNYGVLSADTVSKSASAFREARLIHPEPRLTILVGTVG